MLDQLIIDYIKSSKDQVAIFTDVYTNVLSGTRFLEYLL